MKSGISQEHMKHFNKDPAETEEMLKKAMNDTYEDIEKQDQYEKGVRNG